ncbi:hypothetical protein HAX54_030796 [Datura stramonium]|uniref:Uncharacterized protein n=1 Tax=Datura stramonium TaxID=4076 RepID=A0ABS8SBF6_DATST|nr:hypothetical protein [Datura stramonium]
MSLQIRYHLVATYFGIRGDELATNSYPSVATNLGICGDQWRLAWAFVATRSLQKTNIFGGDMVAVNMISYSSDLLGLFVATKLLQILKRFVAAFCVIRGDLVATNSISCCGTFYGLSGD